MKVILIVLLIWLIASFIYKKVKKTSFPKAMISIILGVAKFIVSSIGDSSTDYSSLEKKAREAGRKDVLEQIRVTKEMQKAQNQMTADIVNSYIERAQFKVDEIGKNKDN